jgi:hypothetical protein
MVSVNVSAMKNLVGKKQTKLFKFMGEELKISKLSVADVLEIQTKAQKNEGDQDSLEILKSIIRSSVEGAVDLSDQDFETFPMDELAKLSSEIMKFSGLDTPSGKN